MIAGRAFITLALRALVARACLSIARRLGDERPIVARRRLALSGVLGVFVLLLLLTLVLRR